EDRPILPAQRGVEKREGNDSKATDHPPPKERSARKTARETRGSGPAPRSRRRRSVLRTDSIRRAPAARGARRAPPRSGFENRPRFLPSGPGPLQILPLRELVRGTTPTPG